MNTFMLPNPYWPFTPLSNVAAQAMRQLLTQQQQQHHLSDSKLVEQINESRSRTPATGFTASQLAASNFESQTHPPTIPPSAPPITSNSLTAALSAWYGQQTSQAHFTQDIGSQRSSPPLPPLPLPPPHSQAVHNPGFIRSMLSVAMTQPKEGSGESANHHSLEGTDSSSTRPTSSSSPPPASSSSDSSSLAAMMAAAAVAMAGLCRTSGVPAFPGVADQEPSSAFQMSESQMNGGNDDGGLNLSTTGDVTEHSSNVTAMEEGDEDDIFLRHMDKVGASASRRRKMHRKREMEMRACGNKNETFESRFQHHSGTHQHHQQQRPARKLKVEFRFYLFVGICLNLVIFTPRI